LLGEDILGTGFNFDLDSDMVQALSYVEKKLL
jgi:hypothetical protein